MSHKHQGPDGPARPGGGAPDADRVITEDTVTIDSAEIRPETRLSERNLWIFKDEVIRAAVALLLLGLLTYIVVRGFDHAKTWADTKELLDQLLPAVTALLGSAVGFYFGTKSGN
ncbi:MAG: hypothetical protein ACJ762_07435 [Solirubrobacteraceae bacterium]